jgi:hypothetical protein
MWYFLSCIFTEGKIVVKIGYWYIFYDHVDFRWSINEEVVNL